MRSEEEVLEMIEEMKKRTKGRYITQGVSFNKTCPRQMNLLKKALMTSVSFSGLVKEMLALRFDDSDRIKPVVSTGIEREVPRAKSVGNFL